MARDYHYDFSEEVLALPHGQWVMGPDRVLHYKETPPAPWIPHGTERGYHQHRYHHVPTCDDCRQAHTAYERQRVGSKAMNPASCGTASGYKKHRRNGETPCDNCTTANRTYNRTRMQQVRAERKEAA